MTLNQRAIEIHALEILRGAYGPEAQFRDGQLEAIMGVLAGKSSLVVEKTGWGKSLVYFIATKMLREAGAGPTLIISPLLALMDNQIESASKLRVNAITINSTNRDAWDEVYRNLRDYDAIIVSPERLSNDTFMARLADIRDIRLLVVDEAHSISDWGHDFRPDYQRVSTLIAGLPSNVIVLGTTATANDRVIADIREQLGGQLRVVRGNLMRENLAIQVNPPQTRAQRLAWLVQTLLSRHPLLEGQGIIYCLTHQDCNAVAEYLSAAGVSIRPYYSGMGRDEQEQDIAESNLQSFVQGKTRILAATVKLGMGYDKADIRFIIHFQLPQNLIAYYQQVGRAGRDGKPSVAILLHGPEDEEILSYFIESALVAPDRLARIVDMARAQDGVRKGALLTALNIKSTKLDEALKYLMVHNYIFKEERAPVYRANPTLPFDAAAEAAKQEQLARMRYGEHEALIAFTKAKGCLMAHIARQLDAPDGQEPCGICTNCQGGLLLPVEASQQYINDANRFLNNRHSSIEPRKRHGNATKIDENLQMQAGWCLYADYYSAGGQSVKDQKYYQGRFSPELIRKSAHALRRAVPNNGINCVVPVPSLRRPRLVPDLACGLAEALGIAYCEAVEKTSDAAEQKTLFNGAQQERNIEASTRVVSADLIEGKTILLVDDMVDSRWSFTVIAAKLLRAGAHKVYPFALVNTGGV